MSAPKFLWTIIGGVVACLVGFTVLKGSDEGAAPAAAYASEPEETAKSTPREPSSPTPTSTVPAPVDEAVEEVARTQMYDSSGALYNAGGYEMNAAYRTLYGLAKNGHAEGVYQLGLRLQTPRVAADSEANNNSGYASDTLMEIASGAGHPAATMELVAKEIHCYHRQRPRNRLEAIGHLNKADKLTRLAQQQGVPTEVTQPLLAKIAEVKSQTSDPGAEFFAALIRLAQSGPRMTPEEYANAQERQRAIDQQNKERERMATCMPGVSAMEQAMAGC